MKIYVTHSTNYDFQKEFYEPLINSELYKIHEIILPHKDNTFTNTKEIIKDSDLIISEVSYPSTGQGIELGWAENYHKKIICIYKTGSKYSSSLKVVTDVFIEYKDSEDMINKINDNI